MPRYRYKVESFFGGTYERSFDADDDETAKNTMLLQRRKDTTWWTRILGPSAAWGLCRIDQEEIVSPVNE